MALDSYNILRGDEFKVDRPEYVLDFQRAFDDYEKKLNRYHHFKRKKCDVLRSRQK